MVSPALRGLFRSLRVYHGSPERAADMDALYRRFMQPGALAFDIGSHVGDRISSFRRIGAKVVALEPQPLAYRALRLIHGRDSSVTLVQAACGRHDGAIELFVNSANPTVSTVSKEFTHAADGAEGWEGQYWDQAINVRCVTLDQLVRQYGEPQFVKVDVEGFEADVLGGLSTALPALSFEFTTIQRDVAMRCLERLSSLGQYEFNVALGESQRLEFTSDVDFDEISGYLGQLPHEANSGDVYACLVAD
ncbi:MAG: FkbM family methyltransferase [Hyphomicrobiaceae bacterium]